jgi:DNA-binding IclR family transcriptional regulator
MRMADTVPVLKENQLAFFRAYRALELELKRAPSLNELAERTGYTKPGAQKLAGALAEKGLIEMPQLVGGGTTELGKETLKRYKGIE